MGLKFDDFIGTVNKILEEMKETRKPNIKLNENNKKLTQGIYNLKYRLDIIEQNNLNSTIEIIGIPKVTYKKCSNIVMKIATTLNTDITIETAYRVSSITVNGEYKIIALISKSSTKNTIVNKIRH